MGVCTISGATFVAPVGASLLVPRSPRDINMATDANRSAACRAASSGLCL
jgi:hypothetical protein